jgi:putative SOS response-associated peptidase YedK
MPVVLSDVDAWLDPDLPDPTAPLVPCDGFDAYLVSTAVNSVRNNGPALVEPVPALF